jgi:NAD(P)-dependent dehydrogenase (short-subunit alcohol dehydrogenase family)
MPAFEDALLTHFEETDDAQIRAQFETNVFGLMRVTRAVLPVMRRQRSGHVFNISSMGGYTTGPHASIYSASKFAVSGFTEALATEVRNFGITATNVAPGFFRTDFLDDSSVRYSRARPIPEYDAARARIAASLERNHAQPGDPAALGRLLVEVANSQHRPLHLPIGVDATEAVEQHHRTVLEEIEVWRHRVARTSFTDD